MELGHHIKKDWRSYCQSFFMINPIYRYLLLFLAGSLNVLSYAPFGYWPIIILSLATFIFVLNQAESPKIGFKLGFFYGLGWFTTGISWVHVAIADFGGFPTLVSILLMALLDSYLALFPALAGYLAIRFKQRFWGLSIIPFWLCCEILRGWFLTGFPWLSIGYTQTNGPLIGFAPLIGELGIQALLLLTASVISIVMHTFLQQTHSRVNKRRLLGYMSVPTIIFVSGLILNQIEWFQATNKTTRLALVQGNIEQSIKWQPENELPTMQTYFDLSLPLLDSSDIIIWPEAAIPRLEILSGDFLKETDRVAAKSNAAILTGIVDFQPETKHAYNNIIVLGKKYANDEFGHYKYLHNNRFSKHHLLPIGEFVPFESVLRNLGPLFDLPMSSFSRGNYSQDNLIANGLNISPAICFEVAFSQQVRANIYQQQNASDMILTVSNDAWFGDSHGPWQHLQIAQMRAAEFAKPMIRVTNNGITAVISERGEIVASLPQFKQDVLIYDLPLSLANTPYYQYGHLPLWLTFILLGLISIKKTANIWRISTDN